MVLLSSPFKSDFELNCNHGFRTFVHYRHGSCIRTRNTGLYAKVRQLSQRDGSKFILFTACFRFPKSKLTSIALSASYKVTLIHEDKNHPITFDCPADKFILDVAEEAGVELPYSCRAGSCATCTGLITAGTVDQSDQTMLDEDQVAITVQ